MKKNIFRIIALTLVLVLAFGTLNGCGKSKPREETYYVDEEEEGENTGTGTTENGGDKTESGSKQEGNTSGTTSSGKDTGSKTNGTTGGANNNGKTETVTSQGVTSNTVVPDKLSNPKIKIMSWFDFNLNDKSDPFTRAYNKYAKKYGKNNVELIVVAGEEAYKQKLVAMISSGDAPDIFRVKTDWMPQFAISKFVRPVNAFLDTSALPYQGMVKEMGYKGQNYIAANDGFFSNVVWYNETLFKKYGVKTPGDYYKAGDWTWDNFRKCAKEMTSGGVWGFAAEDFKVLTASAVDAQVVTYNAAKGTFTSNLTGAKFQNALKVTQEMIHVDKSWNPDLTYVTKQFKNRKVAMSYYNVAFPHNQGGMTDTLKFVPAPVQKKGDAHTTMGFGIFWALGNSKNVNVDAAVAFIKMLRTETEADYKDNVRTVHEKYLSDDQYIELRKLSNKGTCYSSNRISTWVSNYQYGFFERLFEKNKPIATVIDEYKPLLNKSIEALK